MSSRLIRRKCHCCSKFFVLDPHNPRRQFFCLESQCRRASKAASQRRWLNKPANRNYFRDKENVERVRAWRRANPGYWRRAKSQSNRSQTPQAQEVARERSLVTYGSNPLGTLQDFVLMKDPVFIGLLAMVTGRTLQEDMVTLTGNLLRQGQNILGLDPGKTSPTYDSKTIDPARACSPGPPEF